MWCVCADNHLREKVLSALTVIIGILVYVWMKLIEKGIGHSLRSHNKKCSCFVFNAIEIGKTTYGMQVDYSGKADMYWKL